MTPIGLGLTFIFAVMAFGLPRTWAAIGIIGATCYVTQGQQYDVMGFHFTSIRIVTFVALIRTVLRGEFQEWHCNQIDKAVFLYIGLASIIFLMRESFATSAVVAQLGWIFNIAVSYAAFRGLIPGYNELEEFMPRLALIITPMAILMALESLGGINHFSAMGGVPEYVELRDGHYRCQGAFRSPITAGTFGATLTPFFAGLYFGGKRTRLIILGIVASTVILICCRSSGPLLAYGSACLGILFWRWRTQMKKVRRIVFLTLLALHLYMKAPVWFLMGRISDIVGGGGWHRAEIVDAAVNHLSNWWFAGTDKTGDWVATQLADGSADLTNQFVAAGIRGGILCLVLFILIFVRSFSSLGSAMKLVRGKALNQEKMLWAMGTALFATVVNFFSVSYFDQVEVVWYFMWAVIAGVSFDILEHPVPNAGEISGTEETVDVDDLMAPRLPAS